MIPCPCGYWNDPQKVCGCAPAVVTKYQKRISGPLLDWIDIHIERFAKLESSNIVANADMRVGEVRKFCKLQNQGQSLMRSAMSRLYLSARAYHRILKLAYDRRPGGEPGDRICASGGGVAISPQGDDLNNPLLLYQLLLLLDCTRHHRLYLQHIKCMPHQDH